MDFNLQDEEAHKNKKIKTNGIEVEEEKVPPRRYPKPETMFGAASILPLAFFFNCDNLPSRNYDVWTFELRALNKEGSPSLPQITSCYAQMRDLGVPISYIYKFLGKKLAMREDRIEITCMGIPVLPTTTADELVEFWLNTNEKNEGTADDRHRVHLNYARKVPSSSS